MTAFVLVDGRIPPQKVDLDIIKRIKKKNVPFSVLYTKWDKVKKKVQAKTRENFENQLRKSWDKLPLMMTTSSLKGDGIDNVLSYIAQLNESLL